MHKLFHICFCFHLALPEYIRHLPLKYKILNLVDMTLVIDITRSDLHICYNLVTKAKSRAICIEIINIFTLQWEIWPVNRKW